MACHGAGGPCWQLGQARARKARYGRGGCGGSTTVSSGEDYRPGGRGVPLNVVVVAACPFPAPRGTPIRIQRLAEAVAARGHRVHVVAYHFGSGEVAPELSVHRTRGMRSYRRLSPGPTYAKLALLDPLLTLKLRQVLRRHPVDIIHAHHFEGLFVARAASLGTRIPVIFDAHTMLTSELPFYPLGLPLRIKRFIAAAFDRYSPALAAHVVTVTERIRDRVVRAAGLPADRVSVIPNGVESHFFAEREGGRARSGNGSPTLIFTGNLAPYQGIELMLRALRKVLNQRGDVRLKIVTNSSFEHYDALALELGIAGSIDIVPAAFEQIPELLAGATVAVNPRIECDGIPVKLLNYMAAGKPIISFAGSAPGARHRETGWLVPDGDVDGFAEGALALLGDAELAASLGRNARRFVEAQHSWERSAEMAENLYRRLIDARAPRSR
jgi:glycosyltransferase involved in cell wall biosynthesis